MIAKLLDLYKVDKPINKEEFIEMCKHYMSQDSIVFREMSEKPYVSVCDVLTCHSYANSPCLNCSGNSVAPLSLVRSLKDNPDYDAMYQYYLATNDLIDFKNKHRNKEKLLDIKPNTDIEIVTLFFKEYNGINSEINNGN